MTASDKAWHEDQIRHGWVMPSATWWKRLPVIRHVRAAYYRYRALEQARFFGRVGIGLGTIHELDAWICYGMARGWEGKK